MLLLYYIFHIFKSNTYANTCALTQNKMKLISHSNMTTGDSD